MEDITHKINITDDNIILIRENKKFKNTLIFSLKNKTVASYILKENNLALDININTKIMEYTDNKITIKYEVVESNETYEFQIEMEKMYEH